MIGQADMELFLSEALRGRLALAHWANPYWYFFTVFVGLNLFQSAFTDWCPTMTILKKLGAKCDQSESKLA